MSERLKIRAQSAPWQNAIILYLERGERERYAKRQVVSSMTFEELDDGAVFHDAAIVAISNDDAQALMDDLWHGGLRPTEGSGSAGSLRATEKHLKDMREINTKLLDKVLGE